MLVNSAELEDCVQEATDLVGVDDELEELLLTDDSAVADTGSNDQESVKDSRDILNKLALKVLNCL